MLDARHPVHPLLYLVRGMYTWHACIIISLFSKITNLQNERGGDEKNPWTSQTHPLSLHRL